MHKRTDVRASACTRMAHVHRMCALVATYRGTQSEREHACMWRGGNRCPRDFSGEYRQTPAYMSTC